MGEIEPHLLRDCGVDAAAMNPALRADAAINPFTRTAMAKTRLKSLLAEHLSIDHDIYILSNTTHGLTATIAGLAIDGIRLDVRNAGYPGYHGIPDWSDTDHTADRTSLITHINPITGQIEPIKAIGNGLTVVDAAQSFATIAHHRDVLQADVFFCPLHKHAGLAVGLGLLAVKKSLQLAGLRAMAGVAEDGTSAPEPLENALEQFEKADGKIVNRLVINVREPLREALRAKGVSMMTAPGSAMPFACMRGLDGNHRFLPAGDGVLEAKYFTEQKATRVSGAIRGRLDDEPLDYSTQFEAFIVQMLKTIT